MWHGNAKRNEGSLHQKIARFGAKGPVLVGSANLDPLSANVNSEVVAVIDDARVGMQFDALINRQLREGNTQRVTAEDLRRDSWVVKAQGWVLRHVFGPIL